MGGWFKQEVVKEYSKEAEEICIKYLGYGSLVHDIVREWSVMRQSKIITFAVGVQFKLNRLKGFLRIK